MSDNKINSSCTFEITENIVKFAIIKKYGVFPCWDTKKGDLDLYNKKIEIKGSIDLDNGEPSSFGPTEKWDIIYFVNCKERDKSKFKVHEIKSTNENNLRKNIKVNATQTYADQRNQGRRPRITFAELVKQLPTKYISIIFYDHIDNL